jgi:hypothetical protein
VTTVDNSNVSNALTEALSQAAQRTDKLANASLTDLTSRQTQVLVAGVLLATSILALAGGDRSVHQPLHVSGRQGGDRHD